MNLSWLIVLGPRSRLPESGDLDLIPPLPHSKLEGALEACGAALEPFEFPAEGARLIPIAEGTLPLELARAAETLACAVGPVTIVDQDFTLRVEVESGTPHDQILARLADAARDLQEKAAQAQDLVPRASLEPATFAPGRPERRMLPPLRTALIAGIVLCWAWWVVKDRIAGCTTPEVQVTKDPPMADTETAIFAAHLIMTSGKGREPHPEGWIELAETVSPTRHLVRRGDDGKTYLCDGWNNPIRCTRTG